MQIGETTKPLAAERKRGEQYLRLTSIHAYRQQQKHVSQFSYARFVRMDINHYIISYSDLFWRKTTRGVIWDSNRVKVPTPTRNFHPLAGSLRHVNIPK